MIRALIFDFDGLIMDTETTEVQAWQEVYAEYEQEFPVETWVRDVVGSSITNMQPARHLRALTGQELDEAALDQRTLRVRLAKQAVAPAMPGVEARLEEARQMGLRLALASSSKHAWVDGYLRQLGLFGYFEVIKCREDVERIKPEPDLFLKALEGLGLEAGEALAFEDSPNGIRAAKRAGLRVVAVPNPTTVHGDISEADLRLGSLEEMPLAEVLGHFGEQRS
jgi:HAD superfamily hydrolase (TIGR01509 family)